MSFNGTASTNAIEFLFDPDGLPNGTARSVQFLLYTNGRITSRDKATSGTTNSSGNTYNPDTQYDPPWFSWN